MSVLRAVKGVGISARRIAADPRLITLTASISFIASGAAQNILVNETDDGLTPTGFVATGLALKVTTAEVTGTGKTIDIGPSTDTDSLADDIDVSATGYKVRTGGAGEIVLDQQIFDNAQLQFVLGSADFAELQAELIITGFSGL